MLGELGRNIGKVGFAALVTFSTVDCTTTTVQSPPNASGSTEQPRNSQENFSSSDSRAIDFSKKVVGLFNKRDYNGIKELYDSQSLRDMQAADKYFDYHLKVIADNYYTCQRTGHPLQLDKPQILGSKKQTNGDTEIGVMFAFANGECLASGIDLSGRAIPWHITNTTFIVIDRGGKSYLSLVM